MQHRFLLVDGHSIAFRAFYALPDSLQDREGTAAQVVYGFISILFKQIAELDPQFVCVVFDEGRPFREAIFEAYKEGRQEIDPEVQRQVQRLQDVLKALEIPILSAEGYEADDVIATIVKQAAAEQDIQTVVLSGDRDLFALIGPRNVILYPTRSMSEAEVYDAERLWDRWGITPGQVADFKALVGDPSDNIPGVRGVGEKTAAKLLQQFDNLDAIYEKLHTVESTRVRNALEKGRDNAFLSRQLTTLVDSVPGIRFDRAACQLSYNRTVAESAFKELGFESLRNRLPL